jgi:hypothetical protein
MIDWTKEISTKNYCGYCKGTPSDSSCDGTCLNIGDADKVRKNRVDHILTMLEQIPQEIERLKKLEQDYRNSLSA